MSQSVTHVPTNFFVKDVFNNSLKENHEYEQFFWTSNVVDKLMKSFEYDFVDETCCLTTPSLAVGMHNSGRDEVLLDIDRRFGFLPKYKYYDVRTPYGLDNNFRLLILDPPFFVVPIEEFRKAVDILTKHNYSTKLIIGFIKREEKRLLEAFRDYNLKPTSFELEYSSIKPNKWRNFCLYSNVDMPGIKRIH
jgi:hypothetical protein